MTELEQVKRDTYRRLVREGFTDECAQEIVDGFVEVIGYYKGVPSRVRTADGHEMYL